MNENVAYRLRLQINIEQIDPRHGGTLYPGGLALTQDLAIEATDFLQIAHTLGKFHELAEQIKAEHAPVPSS